MVYKEDIFKHIQVNELYYVLKTFALDDVYLSDIFGDSFFEELVYELDVHDIITIASDDRLILTPKGEKIFQKLMFSVELCKY